MNSHGNTRRNDTLKQAAESREESVPAIRPQLVVQRFRRARGHAALVIVA